MLIKKFQNVADKFDNKDAVVEPKSSLSVTFKELYKLSAKIAFKLKKNNVQPGDFVIIELNNSINYYASRFAVWMLGAAVVCLSNQTPEGRKQYIQQHCNSKFSIDKEFLENIDDFEALNESEIVYPDKKDSALVIYTSGTTGKPKGVLHSYESIEKMIERGSNYHKYPDNLIHASFPSVEFIVSILEDVAAFLDGHTVYIIPDDIKLDSSKLSQFIDKYSINKMFIFSQLLKFLKLKNNTLQYVTCGGSKALDIYNGKFQVFNQYGASEAGAMTYFPVNESYENTPIGKSVSNEKIYILDENLKPAKKGEIYFAGYVAKGYLNNPEETKNSFIDNPYKDSDGFPILYKTGDVATMDDFGNLLYVGRNDYMVKVNGQRVEPGEIEEILRQNVDIEDVVVKPFEKDNQNYLCAYYVAKHSISKSYFQEYLSRHLKSYMIPKYYVKLDKIPRSANGKIAYSQLNPPSIEIEQSSFIAPTSSTETKICNAFSKIFSLENVGIEDNFIDLGGDSLKAIELQSYLPQLSYSKIIKMPTPKQLAYYLDNFKDNNIKTKYTLQTGTPLNAIQKYMYYDGFFNESHFPYLIDFEYKLNHGCSATDVSKVIHELINKHPILKARLVQKDDKPWIFYDSYPLITNYVDIAYIDNRETMCSIWITKNKIVFKMSHWIGDYLSLQILKRDLDKLFNKEEIPVDTSFLDICRDTYVCDKNIDENVRISNLKQIYQDYQGKVSIFGFNKNDNSAIFTHIFNVDSNEIEEFSKKHKFPVGIFFMAAYSYLLSMYEEKKDIAFRFITPGRDISNAGDAVGAFFNWHIMRINTFNHSSSIDFLKSFYDIYKTIVDNNIWNPLEVENKFKVHSDIYFNYIDDVNNMADRDSNHHNFTISNLGTTRYLMTTINKSNNKFYADFVLPAYSSKEFITEFSSNYELIIYEYLNNNFKFPDEKLSFVHKPINSHYLSSNKLTTFFSETEIKNEIVYCFKKVFNLNENINEEELDFSLLGGCLKNAIDVIRQIRRDGFYIDLLPIDIIRFKTPRKITNFVINL